VSYGLAVRVLAAHQPNYLPWAGFFHKMLRSDVFVLLQHEKLSKHPHAARAEIRDPASIYPSLLTIPVKHGAGSYAEARLHDARWRHKHLTTIRQAYSKAPHFKRYYGLVEDVLCNSGTFCDITCSLIIDIACELDAGPVVRGPLPLGAVNTSELRGADAHFSGIWATAKLIELCRMMQADVYLSGIGGRTYLDEGAFRKAGVELVYQNFEPPRYEGMQKPGMSILDMLMHVGAEGAEGTRALLAPSSTETFGEPLRG
jgi:hypothetical protein